MAPAVLYHEGKTGSGEFLVPGYEIKKHWYDEAGDTASPPIPALSSGDGDVLLFRVLSYLGDATAAG
jgi:hypothetical protein